MFINRQDHPHHLNLLLVQMNFGRIIILAGLAGVRPAAGVQWGNSVEEHITSCENDSNPDKVDFTVRLQFDDGKRYPAKCEYSYSRCPLDGGKCLPCEFDENSNGQSICPNVGEDNDWTSQVGKTFGYLETRVSSNIR